MLRFLPSPTNEEETYVGRIKRDFHIDDYYDALRRYNSDPAYWQQYYRPLPSPDPSREGIRDSIAMAGIPSRSNVFEYGFPEPAPASAQASAPPLQTGIGTIGPSDGEQQSRFFGSRKVNALGEEISPWQFSIGHAPSSPNATTLQSGVGTLRATGG